MALRRALSWSADKAARLPAIPKTWRPPVARALAPRAFAAAALAAALGLGDGLGVGEVVAAASTLAATGPPLRGTIDALGAFTKVGTTLVAKRISAASTTPVLRMNHCRTPQIRTRY